MLWSKFLKKKPRFYVVKNEIYNQVLLLSRKIIPIVHGNHQASRIDGMGANGKVPEEKEVTYSKRTVDILKNSFGFMNDIH